MGLVRKLINFYQNLHEKIILKKQRSIKVYELEFSLENVLPCDHIVRLKNPDGKFEYFQMSMTPVSILMALNSKMDIEVLFKQLTGDKSGQIYNLKSNQICCFEKDCSYFSLEEENPNNLVIVINGLSITIDKENYENNLQKKYGKNITLRQLLRYYKQETDQKDLDINNPNDFETIRRVVESEEILLKGTDIKI